MSSTMSDAITEKDPRTSGIVHVTNITGPITGPVIMGNEAVTLGAEGQSSSPYGDAPKLKLSNFEITPDKGTITFGGATLKYRKTAFNETQNVDLTYASKSPKQPQHFIRASSHLKCQPALKANREMDISIPTFCSTERSVPVSAFKWSDECGWQLIEENILGSERQITLFLREFSNVSLFLPADRIRDVDFCVASFLFNDADGKFVMGFCLNDEAVKSAFCHRIKKEGFGETVDIPDVLKVRLGDELAFKIEPGQVVSNTKMVVDEDFVTGTAGFTSRCTLNKDAARPQYFIDHFRNGNLVDDYVYSVIPGNGKRKSPDAASGCDVEFDGEADIGNMISSVGHVQIDQSTSIAENGATKSKDKVTYKESTVRHRGSRNKNLRNAVHQNTGVRFGGKTRIGNFVHDADSVEINQRGMGSRGQGKKLSEIERLVEAQNPEADRKTERSGYQMRPEVANAATPFRTDSEEDDDSPIETNDEDAREIDLRKSEKKTRRRKQASHLADTFVEEASKVHQHASTSGNLDRSHIVMMAIIVFLLVVLMLSIYQR